MYNEKNHQ